MASLQSDIILLYVRWSLRYSLSYRDLEEILLERGQHGDDTTIYRWVQPYAPHLEQRCRPYVKATTDSWRVDETDMKVKKEDVYLDRAVDSHGNTLNFRLSTTRDAQAAKRFFLTILTASHSSEPRVINVDKNAAYPKAFTELKAEGCRSPSSSCPRGCTSLAITILAMRADRWFHYETCGSPCAVVLPR